MPIACEYDNTAGLKFENWVFLHISASTGLLLQPLRNLKGYPVKE